MLLASAERLGRGAALIGAVVTCLSNDLLLSMFRIKIVWWRLTDESYMWGRGQVTERRVKTKVTSIQMFINLFIHLIHLKCCVHKKNQVKIYIFYVLMKTKAGPIWRNKHKRANWRARCGPSLSTNGSLIGWVFAGRELRTDAIWSFSLQEL